MDSDAAYSNHAHYITEGWKPEPKFIFRRVAGEVERLPETVSALEVGCATGELVGYLASLHPGWRFTGLDIFEELLAEARRRVPGQSFIRENFLEHEGGPYDLITAVGVITLFDGVDFDRFWTKASELLRPGGTLIVLGPFNEFGVDLAVEHRKWMDGKRRDWERGWSVPSILSAEVAMAGRFADWTISPYAPELDLEPRPDPVRTWTVPYAGKARQLTNGLKLLIDYSVVVARR